MILKTVLTTGFLLAGLTSAHAATLFSDDFNSSTQGLNGTPSGWTVSNGTVDVIGTGFFEFYPGNGNYIDMDGSSGNAGRIDTISTFNLVAGQSYTISFDYGKNGSSAETLNFGVGSGLASLVLAAGGIGSLLSYSFTFVATAADTNVGLFFEALGGDNFGPIIDNVKLADARVSAVPVPGALPLMLTGLAGLYAFARRRKQHR